MISLQLLTNRSVWDPALFSTAFMEITWPPLGIFLECFTLTDLGEEVRGQFTDALRFCSSFESTNSRVASVGLADSVRTYVLGTAVKVREQTTNTNSGSILLVHLYGLVLPSIYFDLKALAVYLDSRGNFNLR